MRLRQPLQIRESNCAFAKDICVLRSRRGFGGLGIGLAVNHALRYIKPGDELRKAIVDGQMRTRDDVKREVVRMLADESL
ncbi:MAG: DUF1592 domain-containing protein [Rubripirellula sp.]